MFAIPELEGVRAPFLASKAEPGTSRFSKRPCFRNRGKHWMLTSGLFLHTHTFFCHHTHTCTHTNTHSHTCTHTLIETGKRLEKHINELLHLRAEVTPPQQRKSHEQLPNCGLISRPKSRISLKMGASHRLLSSSRDQR